MDSFPASDLPLDCVGVDLFGGMILLCCVCIDVDASCHSADLGSDFGVAFVRPRLLGFAVDSAVVGEIGGCWPVRGRLRDSSLSSSSAFSLFSQAA